MSKKIITWVGLLVISVALVGCGRNGGGEKVGVIDMNALFQSPVIQQMGQQLMGQAGPEQAKLKAAYQEVMATRTAVAKATGASKKALQDKLKTQEASFSTLMKSAQQNQAQQEQAMQDKVTAAIAKVAGDEGVSFVYAKQAVLFGNTDDITDKVIKQLG